jgi:hypothetical protein
MKTPLDRINLDPDLEALLPRNEADEAALEAAVAKTPHWHVPLVVDAANVLLDGYRVHRAMTKLGRRSAWVTTLVGLRPEDRALKRVALNLNRRHLTATQKREVVRKLLELNPALPVKRLAREMGMSRNTVKKIKAGGGQIDPRQDARGEDRDEDLTVITGPLAQRNALQRVLDDPGRLLKGDLADSEELRGLVENPEFLLTGEHTSPARYRKLLSRKVQDEAAAVGALAPAVGDCRLHHGRFQELPPLEPGIEHSAGLVLTDLPWSPAWCRYYGDFARFLRWVLRPGGLAVIYSPIMGDNRLLAALDGAGLTKAWTIRVDYRQPSAVPIRIGAMSVINTWRPILVYTNVLEPTLAITFIDNLTSAGPDKRYHPQGQPVGEVRELLRRFSRAGDLVVDPCGGGFSTAEACLREGRQFVGCDPSERNVNIGKFRLVMAGRETVPA